MTTNAIFDARHHRSDQRHEQALSKTASYLVPLGRLFFVAIFLMSGPMHFSPQMFDHARQAGVPFAEILVPLSGVLAVAGGLSVLLGYHARWGAWLLVLFLVPVTVMMHRFWGISDPQMAMMQRINFMKNLSILGGAFMIAFFGAGPISIDARRRA